MNSIRSILFDKDGTLIDFNSIWIPLAFKLVGELLSEYGFDTGHKKILLERIGLYSDGNVTPGSIYASGTEDDVAWAIYNYLKEYGKELPAFPYFLKNVKDLVRNYMADNKSSIRTIGNVGETLSGLKKKGFILGISTSDSEENTRICLEETGILKYFDYIGCPGENKRPKPAGDILMDFCANHGMDAGEVAVVGDTMTDISFARRNKAGLAIGVLSGAGDRNSLAEADILLRDINELTSVMGADI